MEKEFGTIMRYFEEGHSCDERRPLKDDFTHNSLVHLSVVKAVLPYLAEVSGFSDFLITKNMFYA